MVNKLSQEPVSSLHLSTYHIRGKIAEHWLVETEGIIDPDWLIVAYPKQAKLQEYWLWFVHT